MTASDNEARRFSGLPTTAAKPIAVDEALQNNWLEIWYQPKIDLKRKCLAGAEALARIRHPQEGMLWPQSFLPGIDEESLAHLTEHALLTTLRNWTIFADAGFNLHLPINVPVSALWKLPIARLVVAEPAAIRELARPDPGSERGPDRARHRAGAEDRGRTQGLRRHHRRRRFRRRLFSFSSLRDVPFAELKVDGSFVKNCATDANNAAICQTAIDLAHRFGSMAVAEGIENMTDLQALVAMGCDFGHGMLMAPPMPKERFLELLRQRMNKPRPQPRRLAASAAAGRVA